MTPTHLWHWLPSLGGALEGEQRSLVEGPHRVAIPHLLVRRRALLAPLSSLHLEPDPGRGLQHGQSRHLGLQARLLEPAAALLVGDLALIVGLVLQATVAEANLKHD